MLRKRAENRLNELGAADRSTRIQTEAQRIIHELHVHQIELEMQNEELRIARNEMEVLLEKFTDLYDFAPVGYFSLDSHGRIMEANLAGATMLGVDRGELIEQSLTSFTTKESRPAFLSFLEQVFAEPEKKYCETILVKMDDTAFWAALHGTSDFYANTPHDGCRVTISDITAQRQAEEAQHQLNTMSLENQALQQEIVQRKAAEKDLRESERKNTELLKQSNHLQQQLRSLSHRVLTLQEEERKRISRDLHDGLTQTLISINVQLESFYREASANPKDLRKGIEKMQKQVEQLVNLTHRFARELRPPVLDDLGLIPVLEDVLKSFMRDTGIRVSLKAYAGVENLAIEKRTVLYRVAQEALANVARHAHASQVKVTIKKLATAVHMQIKDNGSSFKVEKILRSKRRMPLGLLGMRERVEMVGGTFSIMSAPADGTAIHVLIPMESDTGRKPVHES